MYLLALENLQFISTDPQWNRPEMSTLTELTMEKELSEEQNQDK